MVHVGHVNEIYNEKYFVKCPNILWKIMEIRSACTRITGTLRKTINTKLHLLSD